MALLAIPGTHFIQQEILLDFFDVQGHDARLEAKRKDLLKPLDRLRISSLRQEHACRENEQTNSGWQKSLAGSPRATQHLVLLESSATGVSEVVPSTAGLDGMQLKLKLPAQSCRNARLQHQHGAECATSGPVLQSPFGRGLGRKHCSHMHVSNTGDTHTHTIAPLL